jgi:hypothetical protein
MEQTNSNEVTFIGWGHVFDVKSDKILCTFSGAQRDAVRPRMGRFTTSDQKIIKKLDELGYKRARAEEQ